MKVVPGRKRPQRRETRILLNLVLDELRPRGSKRNDPDGRPAPRGALLLQVLKNKDRRCSGDKDRPME